VVIAGRLGVLTDVRAVARREEHLLAGQLSKVAQPRYEPMDTIALP